MSDWKQTRYVKIKTYFPLVNASAVDLSQLAGLSRKLHAAKREGWNSRPCFCEILSKSSVVLHVNVLTTLLMRGTGILVGTAVSFSATLCVLGCAARLASVDEPEEPEEPARSGRFRFPIFDDTTTPCLNTQVRALLSQICQCSH